MSHYIALTNKCAKTLLAHKITTLLTHDFCNISKKAAKKESHAGITYTILSRTSQDSDTLSSYNPLNLQPSFVTFDRTLSFKYHVLSLRKKFHSRFRAFRSIASASWGHASKECTTKQSLYSPHPHLCFLLIISEHHSPSWHTPNTTSTTIPLNHFIIHSHSSTS